MTASKIVAAAASGAGSGATLDVDQVFSCHLYAGDGTNGREINNGIDLSGEGAMVWFKARTTAQNHRIFDTERGSNYSLITNSTAAQADHGSGGLNSFDDDGFTLGNAVVNGSGIFGGDYTSWTFRKAPKFFDVVTYTGNGQASNNISHDLNSIPGFVISKRTDSTGNWNIAARQSDGKYVSGAGAYPTALNLTAEINSITGTNGASDMNLTSTTFDAKRLTGWNSNDGSGNPSNINNATYVAYLFAHNDGGDGEFGPDSDQDIIKCGSVITDGSGNASVDLGFEPQFILWKCADSAGGNEHGNWRLNDVMRGYPVPDSSNPFGYPSTVYANTSGAETINGVDGFIKSSTGFGFGQVQASKTYIFMAIRRGPLAVPEDATKFFAISTNGQAGDSKAPAYRSTFPVDMYFEKSTGGSPAYISSRLTGSKYMQTNATNAEATDSSLTYDFMNGVYNSTGSNSAYYGYMWKRAPGYFDVVAYTGSGSNATVAHNLGVAPEIIYVKRRDSTGSWTVLANFTSSAYDDLLLNSTVEKTTRNNSANQYLTATPTTTGIPFGSGYGVNVASEKYIAYLFATAPGVSKVGSVTHSGSSTDVDCGFASGARFVLLKRTDSTGSWVLFDTARGITSGNDPYLKLNSTAAQVTTLDHLDPLSSGFQITGDFNDGDYIFLAIA